MAATEDIERLASQLQGSMCRSVEPYSLAYSSTHFYEAEFSKSGSCSLAVEGVGFWEHPMFKDVEILKQREVLSSPDMKHLRSGNRRYTTDQWNGYHCRNVLPVKYLEACGFPARMHSDAIRNVGEYQDGGQKKSRPDFG